MSCNSSGGSGQACGSGVIRRPGFKIDHFTTKPSKYLRVDVMCTIAAQRCAREVWPWLLTARCQHPYTPLYVICDEAGALEAEGCIKRHKLRDVEILQVIDEDTIAYANDVLRTVAVIHEYWSKTLIWFKLAGLKQIMRMNPGAGVLLSDSDIVFRGPITDFRVKADVVLSPFYWGEPYLPVKRPDGTLTTLVERDGVYNAGFLLTNSMDVVDRWMEFYLCGVGGFYEQGCLQDLSKEFCYYTFGPEHNFGKWRLDSPPEWVKSIHMHLDEAYDKNKFSEALVIEGLRIYEQAKSVLS